MGKYCVTVKENFGGTDIYDIEASNPYEAKIMALEEAADNAIFIPMYLTRRDRMAYFKVISCIEI